MSRPRKPPVATTPKPTGKTFQIPNCCPKCKSKAMDPIPSAKALTRPIVGKVFDFEYVAVSWQTKRCVCGQSIAVRTYFAG